MKNIEIDKPMLRVLRTEIDEAVESLGKKYGVTIRTGNCSFNPIEATFKLKVVTTNTKVVEEKKQNDFARYAKMFGLKESDLGREFRVGGVVYTITDIAPNRSKFPILGQRNDGRKFKFKAETVIERLRGQK